MRIVAWFVDEEKKQLEIAPIMTNDDGEHAISVVAAILERKKECWLMDKNGLTGHIAKPDN